jgi:uncharacterized protein involved in exopolysaccharide biosynthesis
VYVLFKRKWSAVAAFAALMSSMILLVYLISPSYEANTQILVRSNPQQQLILFKDLATPGAANPKINPALNLVEISKSRGIAETIVKKFGLDKEKELVSPRDYIKNAVVETILSPLTFAQWMGWLEEAPKDYLADAIEELVDDMEDIEVESDTEIINLKIWGPTPQLAMDISNAMAEILVEKTRSIVQSEANEAHEFTETQVAHADTSLKAAEEALAAFMEKEKIISIGDEKRLLLETFDERNAKYAAATADLDISRARLAEVGRQLASQEPEIISSTLTTVNPLVTDLKTSLNSLSGQLASLQVGKDSLHPKVFESKAQIDELKTRLAGEDEMAVHSKTQILNPIHQQLLQQRVDLLASISGLEAGQSSRKQDLNGIEANLNALRSKELEHDRLNRDVLTHRERFTTLKAKLLELEVQRLTRIGDFDVRVVDKAFVPADADCDFPDWELTIIVGTVVMFGAALSVPFLLEYFDDSLVARGQTEALLGLPVLGTVPKASRAAWKA